MEGGKSLQNLQRLSVAGQKGHRWRIQTTDAIMGCGRQGEVGDSLVLSVPQRAFFSSSVISVARFRHSQGDVGRFGEPHGLFQ